MKVNILIGPDVIRSIFKNERTTIAMKTKFGYVLSAKVQNLWPAVWPDLAKCYAFTMIFMKNCSLALKPSIFRIWNNSGIILLVSVKKFSDIVENMFHAWTFPFIGIALFNKIHLNHATRPQLSFKY